jgi:fluoride ion exporter CrcB/FEX
MSSGGDRVEERWPAEVAALALASYVGVLLRLGLMQFNDLQLAGGGASGAAYVFGSLYAEVVGCVIMGVVLANKPALQRWYRATAALFFCAGHAQLIARARPRSVTATVALTTGVAGSVTTFSSWQSAAMEAAVNLTFSPASTPAGQVGPCLGSPSVWLGCPALADRCWRWRALVCGVAVDPGDWPGGGRGLAAGRRAPRRVDWGSGRRYTAAAGPAPVQGTATVCLPRPARGGRGPCRS